MILLDSSVLIDYMRGSPVLLQSLFRTSNYAVCGIVRAEVLAGSRSVLECGKYIGILNQLGQVSTPESVWDAVGDYTVALRAGGVAIPFADRVVAAVAIANGVELWTRDRHFMLVQRVLPALKLFQEPP
jgi:predicted nucleic acid-binding protein